MEKREQKHLIFVAAAIIGMTVIMGVAWGIDQLIEGAGHLTSSTKVNASALELEAAEADAEAHKGIDGVTVSGYISNYGEYTLVFHDGYGEISPGVPNKNGQLANVVYDPATGALTANAMAYGNVVGTYRGVLSKDGNDYKYEGTFTNNSGKVGTFTMRSR